MLPGSHEGSLGFFEATDPRAPRGIGLPPTPATSRSTTATS
jgi:hypothetical protein